MHGNILLQAKPIGGFRMIGNEEADDKIIAVMNSDKLYASWNEFYDFMPQIPKSIKA